eukprot:2621617-Rhodomonas_salina.1
MPAIIGLAAAYVWTPGISLRPPYARPGSNFAYGATRDQRRRVVGEEEEEDEGGKKRGGGREVVIAGSGGHVRVWGQWQLQGGTRYGPCRWRSRTTPSRDLT